MDTRCERRDDCRFCHSTTLVRFLSLGSMPHAGDFLQKEQRGKESSHPLDVFLCTQCGLVQLLHVLPASRLFTASYCFASSVSQTLVNHFREYASYIVDTYGKDIAVLEVGCNDGVLLEPLQQHGVRVLGVDASANVTKIAQEKGIPVLTEFFSEQQAKKIVQEHGQFDIITGSNVFAHIDDMHDIMRGVQIALRDSGTYIMEVHYLVDVLESLQYDMIYHEHLNYYSLTTLSTFFTQFGMELVDAERTSMHGGGLRVFARKNGSKTERLKQLLEQEQKMRITDEATFHAFATKVAAHKEQLCAVLQDVQQRGGCIAGYGASGRANTVLNYCGIGTETIQYILDDSPLRAGTYTPGTHIPIVLPKDRPEPATYMVLLAWNYAAEIMEREKGHDEQFIITFPEPKLLN
ncbi:MAG: class I SAM-dependent methyltransferase [Candidatus Woesearchaeota archaeon]|nr:class I SAM-dependent methyltransferase [Candidatus Woesearchaeota archaeon]